MSDKPQIASESGHWYDEAGQTAYEVPYADPKKGMRATTIRDAKKLNLFPSVTTVMSIMDKPGLNRWKQMNMLESALTLPALEGESLDSYAKRVIEDAAETGRKAAQRGTDIHGSLERSFQDRFYDPEHIVYVDAVRNAMTETFGLQDW